MVGHTIAQYQIKEKLGAGGMGEIYRAHDTRLARTVAIKVLPQSQVDDPERRRRFLQEARAASALNHPNIITIHDIVFENDTAFMVMEFIDGETLGERIAAGPVPVQDVLAYAIQMADALGAAHDAGIIHRDLKPANVMLTSRGLVKILDFGLAKLSAFAAAAGSAGDSTTATVGAAPLTVEGSILGTVSYMSPEQAEGKPVDARSDIFSFGVMLYEMLTGSRPFIGDSTLSILSSILREEARPVSASSPSIPRPMDELVRRCIAKQPHARFQTMAEVRDALTLLKSDSAAQTMVTPPRRPAGKFPTLAVAAVGLAFAAAGAVWWTLGHRNPAPATEATPPPPSAVAPPPAAVIPPEPKRPVTAPPEKSKAAPAPPPAPAAQPPSTPAPSVAAPATVAVTVPDAMPFKIELAEDVPADAEPGRPVHFTVSQELRIGSSVVVPLHAPVAGEIVDGAKKKLIGGTRLTFKLKSVTGVGGAILALRVAASERDTRRPVESATGPKPGKGFAAVIGTEYMAYTSGQQTVQAPK